MSTAEQGHILIKGLWGEDAFETPWWFVHYAVLPPGGGIGHHRHDECEEMFTILDNAAQFTHNGRTAEVVGGATVPCRKGNPTQSTTIRTKRHGS